MRIFGAKTIFMLVVGLAFSSCVAIQLESDRYAIYGENLVLLRSLDFGPINVEAFGATFHSSDYLEGEQHHLGPVNGIRCFVDAYISPPDERSFSDFVRDSFVFELMNSDRYSETASLVISGDLEEVKFSFDRAVGFASFGGTWSYKISLHSSNGKSLTLNSSYSYETPYQSSDCREMADALMPSVQNLVHDIFSHEEFTSLVSAQ